MNIEEKKEKLKHMQRFFFTSFWISFILLIFSSFLCIAMHDSQIAFVNKYFPLNDIKDYNYLVILILGIWKVLIIQFTLIPGLAVWCIRKCCKCGCCKE